MAHVEVIEPTYQLTLTRDEAEGLSTLIGWGTTGGVAEDLGVRQVRTALEGAGVKSNNLYPFTRLASR